MKRNLFFLAALVVSSFSLSAKIVESRNISDVLGYIHEDTLMIYDIDNTLAKENTESGWGGDQWVYALVNQFIEHGLTPSKAWDIALPIYFSAQHSKGFGLVPIEDQTISVFKESQQKADKVIALTARSYPLIQLTVNFLHAIDIDFRDNGFEEEFVFDEVPSKYTHGMFFCGHGDKGQALLQLFHRIDYAPKKVVFIDDKMKNIKAVERAVEGLGIEFVGIHYLFLEEEIKNFKLTDVVPEETLLTPVVVS